MKKNNHKNTVSTLHPPIFRGDFEKSAAAKNPLKRDLTYRHNSEICGDSLVGFGECGGFIPENFLSGFI